MAETLGIFEQAVMLAVVRLGQNAYGRAIFHDVQERIQRDVAAGAVHATLDRLEKKRLLVSRLEPGTPMRNGRARRFYGLEPAGVVALNDARATLTALWSGLRSPLTRPRRA